MREFKYKGNRFRQPFRFIFSLIYTIVYTFKHRKLRLQIRIGLQLTAALCMLGMLIPAVAFTIIPDPVKADDDDTVREVMKLKGTAAQNPKALKEQVIIQKATSQNIDLSKVNTQKSVVAVTYPAPVSNPGIQNVEFKAKIVTNKSEPEQPKKGAVQSKKNSTSATAQTVISSKKDSVKSDDSETAKKTNETATPEPQSTASANPEESTSKTNTNEKDDSVKATASPDSEKPSDKAQEEDSDKSNDDEKTSETPQSEKEDDASAADEIQDLDVKANNVQILGEETDDHDSYVDDQQDETAPAGEEAPIITLKSDKIVLNNGSEFNPAALIYTTKTAKGNLPALQIDSNVNTKKDGTYTCTIKAIDQNGRTTTKTVSVIVQTHPEQAAIQKQEAQLKKEHDRAVRHAANIAAVRAAGGLLSEESSNRQTGPSYNPYPGSNYNNCTWAAWQLAHDNLGINLPGWGNAGYWLAGAQASGYATGKIPMKGSIMVSAGGLQGMGHVAYVADVSKDGKSVYVKQGSYTDGSGVPWSGSYSETWQNAYGSLISGMPILGYIYLD